VAGAIPAIQPREGGRMAYSIRLHLSGGCSAPRGCCDYCFVWECTHSARCWCNSNTRVMTGGAVVVSVWWCLGCYVDGLCGDVCRWCVAVEGYGNDTDLSVRSWTTWSILVSTKTMGYWRSSSPWAGIRVGEAGNPGPPIDEDPSDRHGMSFEQAADDQREWEDALTQAVEREQEDGLILTLMGSTWLRSCRPAHRRSVGARASTPTRARLILLTMRQPGGFRVRLRPPLLGTRARSSRRMMSRSPVAGLIRVVQIQEITGGPIGTGSHVYLTCLMCCLTCRLWR